MWEQFFVSVGLVVLGFGLGRLPPWLDRRRRVRSHWQALRGELLLSTERVNTFLDDNVKAPLYRLPTRAFDAALKALLSEGLEISPDEMKILYESADLIGDLNRGLDACAALEISDEIGKKINQHHDRNRMKADRLQNVILPGAIRIVAGKLS